MAPDTKDRFPIAHGPEIVEITGRRPRCGSGHEKREFGSVLRRETDLPPFDFLTEKPKVAKRLPAP